MIAETSDPKSTSWPRTLKPSPFAPPPPAAFTSGVITAPVNALTSVLNASAIERPTATTTSWPCMRKFLKPLSIAELLSAARRVGRTLCLRLIEQLLPALEERGERVAALLVRGEHVDVRPVLGELPLELGHLCLADSDLRLDPLELGASPRFRLRRLWLPGGLGALHRRFGPRAGLALLSRTQQLRPAAVVGT